MHSSVAKNFQGLKIFAKQILVHTFKTYPIKPRIETVITKVRVIQFQIILKELFENFFIFLDKEIINSESSSMTYHSLF